MLQVGRPVEDFLQLVLGVSLDLPPVGIHKGLGVTQAPAEEGFELVPRDRDRAVSVSLPLVLLPAKADPVSEEGRGKGNSGRPRSSSGSKVVLTLLTEVVAVYVGLSAIYIRGTGLQLLLEHLGDDGSWDESGSGSENRNLSLQNGLEDPLQVIFGVLRDNRSSGRLWPWGSIRLFGNF